MEQLGSCGRQNGRIKLESNLILEGGVRGEKEAGRAGGVSSAGEVREHRQLSSPLCMAVRFSLVLVCAKRLVASLRLLLWDAASPSLSLLRPPARAVAGWGFARLAFAPEAPLLPECQALECLAGFLNRSPHPIVMPTLQIGKPRLREVAQGHKADKQIQA